MEGEEQQEEKEIGWFDQLLDQLYIEANEDLERLIPPPPTPRAPRQRMNDNIAARRITRLFRAFHQTMTHNPPARPRVGGNLVADAVYNTVATAQPMPAIREFWCGGEQTADAPTIRVGGPRDILAYRPETFKERQRHDIELKKGIDETLWLELPENGKMKTPVMIWIQALRVHIEERGIEPVFYFKTTDWHYLLTDVGKVKLEQIKTHQTNMSDATTAPGGIAYDRWDTANLRIAAAVIRNSLGPNLKQRIASLLEADANGVLVFKMAVDQVMYMNATTVRNLSNQLGSLELKKFPGESVPGLGEKITELAREIEGSGSAPTDLLNLVSKPYTKGTVDGFKQFAITTHNNVMKGTYGHTWSD